MKCLLRKHGSDDILQDVIVAFQSVCLVYKTKLYGIRQ